MIRDKIFRNVSQYFMKQKSLCLEEGLLLDYLINYYEEDINIHKDIDNKRYYWCKSTKIFNDLPILDVGERQLRRYLHHLEKLNIVEFRMITRMRYFYISTATMFEANSDEKFYFKLKPEQELSIVKKICLIYKRGL